MPDFSGNTDKLAGSTSHTQKLTEAEEDHLSDAEPPSSPLPASASLASEPGDAQSSSSSGSSSPSAAAHTQTPPNGHANGNGKHCHEYSPKNGKSQVDWKSARRIIIALCLCTAFMICEVVGGVLSNSLAIATDAAHLLTDIISFAVSLTAIYLAGRPATRRMTYGWARTEVVGALLSVLLIYVVTGVLIYMAAMRIVHKDFDIDAKVMLITASLGIAVNIIMGIALSAGGHGHTHGGMSHGHSHGKGHGHSHGHSHDKKAKQHEQSLELNSLTSSHKGNEYGALSNGDIESGKKCEGKEKDPNRANLNVRAAFIHVIGDLFQSIGVLAAALVIYFKPEWKLADPICTFIFSIIVLIVTGNILCDALNMLLEGVPAGLPYDHVLEVLQGIPGVRVVHDLRIWALSPERPAISVHLVVDETVEETDVLQASLTTIHEQLDIHQVTIQVERYVEEMKDCNQCND